MDTQATVGSVGAFELTLASRADWLLIGFTGAPHLAEREGQRRGASLDESLANLLCVPPAVAPTAAPHRAQLCAPQSAEISDAQGSPVGEVTGTLRLGEGRALAQPGLRSHSNPRGHSGHLQRCPRLACTQSHMRPCRR